MSMAANSSFLSKAPAVPNVLNPNMLFLSKSKSTRNQTNDIKMTVSLDRNSTLQKSEGITSNFDEKTRFEAIKEWRQGVISLIHDSSQLAYLDSPTTLSNDTILIKVLNPKTGVYMNYWELNKIYDAVQRDICTERLVPNYKDKTCTILEHQWKIG